MQQQKASVLRILYFLVFCCTASWLPVLADFCTARGLSENQTSLILSITPVMMFAVQPLYGLLADKFGYKKSLLIAGLFSSVSYLGYIYDGGFLWLVVVTVVMSVFYNTIQPVLDSLSLQLAKANPKFSYGSLRIAGAAGWSVTGIITGQVIDHISIRMIFMISAISMFLFFVAALWLKNDTTNRTVVETSSFANSAALFKNKPLLFLLFCVFIISAGATTIWNFYSMYMKENGASASLVGYGLSFQGLCELPLFYFSARIIFKFGLKTTLIITTLATAVRMLLYSSIHNPVAAIPVELLHGFSWSLFWVVCVEYVNRLVDEKWLATGQSLLYAAYFGAGAIAGNYWTGYLHSQMKLSSVFLLNAAIIAVVAVVLLFFMKKVKAVSA
jgi:MFS transporter, PPP family, 3-phenylpropionic acid transporter